MFRLAQNSAFLALSQIDTCHIPTDALKRAARRIPIQIRAGHQKTIQRLGLALRRLEREHVALLLAIAELEAPGAELDDTTRAINDALRPLLREDLRRTQHALTLAAQGRYGACEICGQPLSRRQLELAPTATRCPGCETRAHLQ